MINGLYFYKVYTIITRFKEGGRPSFFERVEATTRTREESRDKIGFSRKASLDFSQSDRSNILSGDIGRVESSRVESSRAILSLSLSLSGLRVPSQWHEQPDARASTLDLSVLRSSRIARNSSYFVLIRKFVLVQLSRDSTLLPRIANFFSLVSLFVARRANFISPRPRLFHLASPHPPRFQFGTRSEIVPSYLRAISLKCLVRGNWNVDEPIRRWNSRLIFSYELTLIEFHYRQLTKNGKLRLKMIRCAW